MDVSLFTQTFAKISGIKRNLFYNSLTVSQISFLEDHPFATRGITLSPMSPMACNSFS